MAVKKAKPRCIVIAGPNGAGKTTLARELLGRTVASIRFVNADLIAAGLSPLNPESAAVQAGKLLLSEIDRLVGAKLAAKDIARRFVRGRKNFQEIYRPIADSWVIYNNSGDYCRLEECGP